MRKYRVTITERIISDIDLEAESVTDAERKADNIYKHNVAAAQIDTGMSGVTCEAVLMSEPKKEKEDGHGLFNGG